MKKILFIITLFAFPVFVSAMEETHQDDTTGCLTEDQIEEMLLTAKDKLNELITFESVGILPEETQRQIRQFIIEEESYLKEQEISIYTFLWLLGDYAYFMEPEDYLKIFTERTYNEFIRKTSFSNPDVIHKLLSREYGVRYVLTQCKPAGFTEESEGESKEQVETEFLINTKLPLPTEEKQSELLSERLEIIESCDLGNLLLLLSNTIKKILENKKFDQFDEQQLLLRKLINLLDSIDFQILNVKYIKCIQATLDEMAIPDDPQEQ